MHHTTLNRLLVWAFVCILLLSFIAFTGLAALTAPGAAQELNESAPQSASDPTPETDTELYDQLYSLNVHSVEYIETDEIGHAVRVEATWTGRTPERITVTQIPDGRDVAIERTVLSPGDRTEFTIDLVDDSASVLYTAESIENGRALKLKDDSGWLIPGPWSSFDAQLAALAGLLAGLSITTGLAYFRVKGHTDEPERVL